MYCIKELDKKTIISKLITKYYDAQILSLSSAGEGFYGIVYLAKITKEPHTLIIKCYKNEKRHIAEATQLNLLRKHSLMKIPTIYKIHDHTEDIPMDALLMEYVHGTNASHLPTDHPHRHRFTQEMIDNLLHLHSTSNERGFSMDLDTFYPNWNTCYKQQIDTLYKTLIDKHRDNIAPYIMTTVEESLGKFDRIFSELIEKSSLIHSDYNLWNVLVNQETAHIQAIIDPLNACWADSELDLFHLQNADGDRFGLLDYYKSHYPLTDLFPVKNAFYWFWDDIKHMVNMGWYEEKYFISQGNKLQNMMNQYL